MLIADYFAAAGVGAAGCLAECGSRSTWLAFAHGASRSDALPFVRRPSSRLH
jgi:hypothetical protein